MALLEVKGLRAYYKTEMYGIDRTVRAIDDISLERIRQIHPLHKDVFYDILPV